MRTGYVAVALCLVAATTACTRHPAQPDRPPTVSFVVADNQLNFSVEMMDGFRTGADQVGGVREVVVGPSGMDAPRELALFDSVPKGSRDAVGILIRSPKLFDEPVSNAVRSGVPVIAVDNPPDAATQVSLFIGNDNYQLGQMLADEVIQRLPRDPVGRVVIGTAVPDLPVLDQRAAGMRDEFRARTPRVVVVGPVDTEQDVDANLTAWRILTRSNPDALAFLGTGDADGWNLAAVRESTQATWLAGAYDLDPRSLRAVKAGQLLLVSPEHFLKGALAGRIEADHARNASAVPRGWILTPGLAVTPANIDAVLARQATLAARRAWFAPKVDEILGHLDGYLRPLPTISVSASPTSPAAGHS
jgi:ribose transport system substrate-binding protein